MLTADEGASAAALIHWDAWLGRIPLRFTLTDLWNGIEPGLAYAVPTAGQATLDAEISVLDRIKTFLQKNEIQCPQRPGWFVLEMKLEQ